ncbi:hypothetical protein SLA2020_517450 [Shorea laevis]
MPSESDKWGWEHVSVFGGFDRGSGTKRWKCNHCNLRYNGSYSRVRAHLLGFSGVGVKSCPAIDRSLREAFQILEEERLARKKKRTSGSRKHGSHVWTPQSSHVWKTMSKDDVDDMVARFVYASGLDVSIVNSPYFHEMVKAVAAFGSGYEPPSIDKLCDSILSKEKGKIEKCVALVRESWPHTGCTILCVGHLDGPHDCPHINIFVSSPRGLIFLKAVDADNCDEADTVLTNVLSDVILEVGSENVLQIISHIDHACKSSKSFILSKFPHIFWSPCISHSILMLMEEIAELELIKPVLLCARGIEQCIIMYQHSFPCLLTPNLKESSDPFSAKFAPSYCIVKRIFQLKQVLREVVVSEEWKQWRHSIPDNIVVVESSILGDEFWSKVHLMLQLYEPFIRLLSVFDIDKSAMGDVYDWRVQALEAVRNQECDGSVLNELEILIENRWDVLFSPLQAAGYMVNPRYFGRGQARDKTIMRGWKTTLEKYECDSAARRVLREQLSSYWRLEGSLGEEDAVDSRNKMDPVAWWENFGFEMPSLQTLAIKVLSQVSTVGICQEVAPGDYFSCQEASNNFGVERLKDLVFVRNNLKLLAHKNGSSSSSCGLRNGTVSSPSEVKTWDCAHLDQTKLIVSLHDEF